MQGAGERFLRKIDRETPKDKTLHLIPHTAAMAAKMQADEGRAAYKRRKWIAEPPNGWIKSVLGFRQFSLRGLHRVQADRCAR